jgi:hypothetical protein
MLRVLVAFGFFALLTNGLQAAALDVGSPAPDFEFIRTWNMSGGQSRLSEFRGSVVLLETFATW